MHSSRSTMTAWQSCWRQDPWLKIDTRQRRLKLPGGIGMRAMCRQLEAQTTEPVASMITSVCGKRNVNCRYSICRPRAQRASSWMDGNGRRNRYERLKPLLIAASGDRIVVRIGVPVERLSKRRLADDFRDWRAEQVGRRPSLTCASILLPHP